MERTADDPKVPTPKRIEYMNELQTLYRESSTFVIGWSSEFASGSNVATEKKDFSNRRQYTRSFGFLGVC